MYIYIYAIYIYIYIHFQMICQKPCQNSVSGWGPLEARYLLLLDGGCCVVFLFSSDCLQEKVKVINTGMLPAVMLHDLKSNMNGSAVSVLFF